MRGKVIIEGALTGKPDAIIDVSEAVGVKFISSDGTSIEVDMRANGQIVIEADDLLIEPRAANTIYIRSRKIEQ